MLKALLTALLAGHFIVTPLRAQAGSYYPPIAEAYDEIADVSCPTGLNSHFNDYQPVEHQGAGFFSVWMSESRAHPLPSRNWYVASPNTTILSVDGAVRWYDARVRVHCFVTRSMYLMTFHFHPIATSGRTEIVPCTNGPGTAIDEQRYDPYDADPVVAGGCSTGGSGGHPGKPGGDPDAGGSGTDECSIEYIYVEISFDEGKTWEVIWEGYTAVCG